MEARANSMANEVRRVMKSGLAVSAVERVKRDVAQQKHLKELEKEHHTSFFQYMDDEELAREKEKLQLQVKQLEKAADEALALKKEFVARAEHVTEGAGNILLRLSAMRDTWSTLSANANSTAVWQKNDVVQTMRVILSECTHTAVALREHENSLPSDLERARTGTLVTEGLNLPE